MIRFQVRILKRAMGDLESIIAYLRRENPAAAERIGDELLQAASELADLPLRGRRPRDARLRAAGYRYLLSGDYLVFCKVSGRFVRIYRVLHGHRAYQHLLR
jgi:toxin ParE1/3/4